MKNVCLKIWCTGLECLWIKFDENALSGSYESVSLFRKRLLNLCLFQGDWWEVIRCAGVE